MPCKSVLVKCGVPPTMLNIIQSFHKGMASVRVRDGVNDSFEDRNGLWQGCRMAPALFNLYFNALVLCSVRVPVLYKYGRKLVGDCTAKSIGCRKYVSMSINLLMI